MLRRGDCPTGGGLVDDCDVGLSEEIRGCIQGMTVSRPAALVVSSESSGATAWAVFSGMLMTADEPPMLVGENSGSLDAAETGLEVAAELGNLVACDVLLCDERAILIAALYVPSSVRAAVADDTDGEFFGASREMPLETGEGGFGPFLYQKSLERIGQHPGPVKTCMTQTRALFDGRPSPSEGRGG
jgi:hypothetical protein